MTVRQLILLLVLLGLGVATATAYHFKPQLFSRAYVEQVLEQAKSFSIREHFSDGKGDDDKQPNPAHHTYSAEDIEKATREVLQQKQREQGVMKVGEEQVDMRQRFSKEVAPEGKKYLFQLEFANGSGTIAEKVSFGEGTVSYESQGGIKVTVPESSVLSVQRIVIRLQQQTKK